MPRTSPFTTDRAAHRRPIAQGQHVQQWLKCKVLIAEERPSLSDGRVQQLTVNL
jgi:hypothetical protein